MQHWFESYLSNRKQYVSIKNCSSSFSNSTMGVPQGSVLGPVPFPLYMNGMYRSSNQMRFVHFADDTTVFASDSDINNVHAIVNRELVGVDNWHKANRLYLNVSKTSYMIISNQKYVIDIRIRDSILTKVSTVKFLGVTLDANFIFNEHVKNVTNKISKSVGVMRRLYCQLPADVMVKLYYSLVYSHLTYALMSWGRARHTYAAKIECAHRRARKLFADYNHSILHPPYPSSSIAFILPILEYCSPVWWLLPAVTFGFLIVRLMQSLGSVLIRFLSLLITAVALLGCVCCTKFAAIRNTVYMVSCLQPVRG